MLESSPIMKVQLVRELRFEAAHRLPLVPAGHRCHGLHGHSYRVELEVTGEVDPQAGWLVDFARIDEACEPLVARLDHSCLNDVAGLANPTSENLCAWLWRELRPVLPALTAVTVHETVDSRCTYRGEE